MTTALAPVLYLPHGGGPLPLLGDSNHTELTRFLSNLAHPLPRPEAILVISAHWESDNHLLTAAAAPELLFDYSGFPPKTYQYQYPCPGNPQLAAQIAGQLQQAGFDAALEQRRGLDHGVFVPLMLLYPKADIPVIQLSLNRSLNPAHHIALGESLQWLRARNIMIIGSGMSFHNMQAFFRPELATDQQVAAFNQWLTSNCTGNQHYEVRREQLTQWQQAPYARLCHPREEHLLPLHVCFGAAGKDATGRVLFQQKVLNKTVLAFGW